MPGVDGIDATHRMRQLEREHGWTPSRIIAISGLSSSLGEHERTLESGQFNLWITKSTGSLKTLASDLEEYKGALAATAVAFGVPSTSTVATSAARSPLSIRTWVCCILLPSFVASSHHMPLYVRAVSYSHLVITTRSITPCITVSSLQLCFPYCGPLAISCEGGLLA
jgi:hypothetical protein